MGAYLAVSVPRPPNTPSPSLELLRKEGRIGLAGRFDTTPILWQWLPNGSIVVYWAAPLHDSWDGSLFFLRPCYFLLFSYFLSTSSAPFREPCLVDRPTASLVPILECRCSIGNNYRSQFQSMTRDLLTTQFGVCTRAEVDPSCGRRKMRRQGPKKKCGKNLKTAGHPTQDR